MSNKDKILNQLNFSITKKEVQKGVNKLKNKKASGNDGIINEMIKSGIEILVAPLTKFFNSVLLSEIYPCLWRVNLLTPLHKKGNLNIPSNYRGIAVSSTIS